MLRQIQVATAIATLVGAQAGCSSCSHPIVIISCPDEGASYFPGTVVALDVEIRLSQPEQGATVFWWVDSVLPAIVHHQIEFPAGRENGDLFMSIDVSLDGVGTKYVNVSVIQGDGCTGFGPVGCKFTVEGIRPR